MWFCVASFRRVIYLLVGTPAKRRARRPARSAIAFSSVSVLDGAYNITNSTDVPARALPELRHQWAGGQRFIKWARLVYYCLDLGLVPFRPILLQGAAAG